MAHAAMLGICDAAWLMQRQMTLMFPSLVPAQALRHA